MSEEIKPKKERRFLKTLGRVGEILVEQVLLKLGSSIIKKIGGKKTLPSILFIFLSLSLFAQFPNTGNKQRLGFQTTADGLTWRGSISDTASIQPINNQNAWVILDTINLKFYSFDFTSNVWNLVGGAPGLTMPFDSITFNTAKDGTVGVGEVEYNDTQGSLIQGLKGGLVTNVIGQQLHQRVNNRTGSTLTKGTAVYLSGSQGNRITVAKGLAVSDAFSANTFGVVAESIADNASGYIITEGLITGLNTSALTEDSAVYLSPTVAGGLTSTKPQAPQHSVYIGVCVKSNNGSGELFVKIRNGQELDELHDVRITSPLNNASLYYKSNEGLWRDTTATLLVSDTASMLTPYLRDADTVTLSNRINLKLNISDTSAFARDNQISGTSGQVAYFNGSNSVTSNADLIYNAASNTLGINTTTTSGANLIIKNSQEPSRATVVTTQGFAADTTNWTRGTGWTFSGGFAVATAATGDLTYTPSLTITSGNAYEITYTIASYSAGTLTARIGDASYSLPLVSTTNNIIIITPTLATGGFRFSTSSFTGNLDNVSVVEITGSAPILFAGQDDAAATLYNSLRMPNSTTLAFGGGGGRTTGLSNTFIGTNTGLVNTIGANNNFIGNNAGSSNTRGSGNTFIGNNAGLRNVNGISNNFMGENSGRDNVNGNLNVFIGPSAGQSNISGSSNIFFGDLSGYLNTIGSNNNFFGVNSGRSNTTGSSNVAIGNAAMYNATVGDTLTGSNNIAIGTNAGDNIEFAAANNLIIGNGIDLPIDGGSNQVAIKNVYFATDATGAAKNIAASSKAGIKTATPNRDLEVAGEVRITDLTTDAPTRLVGADADGDLGQVTLGAGLSLASSSLLADTNFLVTRFDTASMLTNYLRTGVAASTYLPLTGGTLTGDLNAKYLNTFAKTTYIPFNAGIGEQSIFNVGTALRGGTVMVFPDSNLFSSSANIFLANSNVQGVEYSAMGSGIRNYSKQGGDNRRNSLAFYTSGIGSQNTNRLFIDYDGNVGINDDTPSYKLEVNGTFNATGNITEAGNNVLTNLDTASLSSRINLKYNSTGGTISGAVTLSNTTATPSSLLGKSTGNVVGNVRLTSPLSLAGDSLNLGTVPISKGGTGADNASLARTLLAVGYVFTEVTAGSSVTITSNRVSIVNTGGFSTTQLDLTPATNGRMYMIKNLATGTVTSLHSNVIPFAGGSPTTAILSAGNVTPQWVTLVADGTNWHMIQKN